MNLTNHQWEILFYVALVISITIILFIYIIGLLLHATGIRLFSYKYDKLNEFNKICFHMFKIISIALIVLLVLYVIYKIKGGI